MTKLIIATSSPYRIKALEEIGLKFKAEDSKVNESALKRPKDPQKLVLFLAQAKADSVAQQYKDSIILGLDSVGWFKGQILEKPKNKQEAYQRLLKLSGHTHEFFTGIYLINQTTGVSIKEVVKTKIYFRTLNKSEINHFLESTDKYLTIALGYIPGATPSSSFISKIEGSYTNLSRGIPLHKVVEMLDQIGL